MHALQFGDHTFGQKELVIDFEHPLTEYSHLQGGPIKMERHISHNKNYVDTITVISRLGIFS